VSYLAKAKLRHKTIKVYLSAVRHLHIAEGEGDPFAPSLHRLQYILRGIKRCEAESNRGSRERLPITPVILQQLKNVWERTASDPDTIMIWAACCLAFFGFLRAGELSAKR